MLDTGHIDGEPRRVHRVGGATPLAMGLSFVYLTVMAALMWLFENALALETITVHIVAPRRLNLWLLILLSVVLVFVSSYWAFVRIGRTPIAILMGDGRAPVLPGRGAAIAVACLLRRAAAHSRGRRELLPPALTAHAEVLGRRRTQELHLRRQGKPLHHAHENAQRAEAIHRSILSAGCHAGRAAWAGLVSAATSMAL